MPIVMLEASEFREFRKAPLTHEHQADFTVGSWGGSQIAEPEKALNVAMQEAAGCIELVENADRADLQAAKGAEETPSRAPARILGSGENLSGEAFDALYTQVKFADFGEGITHHCI